MAVAASVTIVEDGPCYSVKLDRIKSKRRIIKVKTAWHCRTSGCAF